MLESGCKKQLNTPRRTGSSTSRMGMQEDLQVENLVKNLNHICQNVTVNTAGDWAREGMKFCRGDILIKNLKLRLEKNTKRDREGKRKI